MPHSQATGPVRLERLSPRFCLHYTFFLAAEAMVKRHPKSASPIPVVHVSTFRGPVNLRLITHVSTSKAAVKLVGLLHLLIEPGRYLRLDTWVHHIKHHITSLANLPSLKRISLQGAFENPYRTKLSKNVVPFQVHSHGLGLRGNLPCTSFRS